TVTVTSKAPVAPFSYASAPVASQGAVSSSGGIDFISLIRDVRANPLTAFGSKIEYLKSLTAEGLINAVDLKVQFGVERQPNGTFAPAAGITGSVVNVGAASVV